MAMNPAKRIEERDKSDRQRTERRDVDQRLLNEAMQEELTDTERDFQFWLLRVGRETRARK